VVLLFALVLLINQVCETSIFDGVRIETDNYQTRLTLLIINGVMALKLYKNAINA
jgi:hypothetical protein